MENVKMFFQNTVVCFNFNFTVHIDEIINKLPSDVFLESYSVKSRINRSLLLTNIDGGGLFIIISG